MKLNFLLTAALVAAPVMAASSTTLRHDRTSTETAKATKTSAASKTSKAAAAPTMGVDMLGVAGVAGVIAAMAL
ncbi:hypothetical protein HYE67_002904 [Fusarium culmorum]|uniref:Uncharacterized protein n=1 Tax=Fusarium culmorum TaxID=5516 RepID=A0A7S8D2C3_FUSCU|nr:hypothetical protein HYE67_002904 [Fusarium culmorum]